MDQPSIPKIPVATTNHLSHITADAICSVAEANSNPKNWDWDADMRKLWTPSYKYWQDFAKKWHGSTANIHANQILDISEISDDIEFNKIFIRSCYLEAEDLVWKLAADIPNHGVILTGQPGIGKTAFIWYLLTRLLSKNQVILLGALSTQILLFFEDQVYTYTGVSGLASPDLPKPSASSYPKPFIWSLIDVAKEEPPLLALTSPRCFPVQAPSPNVARYREWRKRRGAFTTGFPLWSRKELIQFAPLHSRYSKIMGQLEQIRTNWQAHTDFQGLSAFLQEARGLDDPPQSNQDAFEILLDALIGRFGPIIRDLFQAMDNFNGIQKIHDDALDVSLDHLHQYVKELAKEEYYVEGPPSHHVIRLDHPGPIDNQLNWEVAFKSQYTSKRTLEQLLAMHKEEVREWMAKFSKIPVARKVVGDLFESYAHHVILAGTGPWRFRMMTRKSGTDTNAPKFEFGGSGNNAEGFSQHERTWDYFRRSDLSIKGFELKNNTYYIPSAANQPFFDSFIIESDYENCSALLWILQITVASHHGGSREGYPTIREIMQNVANTLMPARPGEPPAKKQKWTPSVETRYVLVRPRHEESVACQWNFPKGWNEKTRDNDHRGDVYVLDIPVQEDISQLVQEACSDSTMRLG